MPGSAIDDSLWAEMTAAQKSEAVRVGSATLRQMVEGLLDGPDELGRACTEVLTRTDASLKELTDPQLPCHGCGEKDRADGSLDYQLEQRDLKTMTESESIHERVHADASHERGITAANRRRLGLPRGYLPRLRRHERLVHTSGVALPRSGVGGGNNDRET